MKNKMICTHILTHTHTNTHTLCVCLGTCAYTCQVIPEFELAKSKKISMSDWSVTPLSERQIQYAAADAFAAVAVVHTLVTSQPEHLQRPSDAAPALPCFGGEGFERLCEALLARELPIEELEERATRRRAAKWEIKSRESILELAQGDAQAGTALDARSRKMWKEWETSPGVFHASLVREGGGEREGGSHGQEVVRDGRGIQDVYGCHIMCRLTCVCVCTRARAPQEEARQVFIETRPDPGMATEDFMALGVL